MVFLVSGSRRGCNSRSTHHGGSRINSNEDVKVGGGGPWGFLKQESKEQSRHDDIKEIKAVRATTARKTAQTSLKTPMTKKSGERSWVILPFDGYLEIPIGVWRDGDDDF